MKELRLTNPLTTEEKLEVARLVGHDSINLLNNLNAELGDIKKASSFTHALRNIDLTVAFLTQNDKIILGDNCDIDFFDINKEEQSCFSFEYFYRKLKEVYEKKAKIINHIEAHRNLLSCKPVLYTVILNLMKNSITAQKIQSNEFPTVINLVQYHEGFPDKALFIPDGAKDYKNFVAFHIMDSGPGFPKDVPLAERLTRCPEQGASGFGLYFTGLAAKVMRAPINIQSQPGNTIVSVYHPIYVEY